ncbi:MAG: SRPBCC family protein [Actinomycetota bacterium]
MKRFEERITIVAPADRVYDYVADMATHAEWSGNGLTVTKSSDGPIAVGTVYATTAKQFGTQREQSTVIETTPGRTFAWDSVGALGRARHTFGLSTDAGSTTVIKSAEIVEPTFLARVTGWKLSKDIPVGLRRDLERIKARLEGSAA